MRKGSKDAEGNVGTLHVSSSKKAVRLVKSGQSQAAARSLGVVEQTLGNWSRRIVLGHCKAPAASHR